MATTTDTRILYFVRSANTSNRFYAVREFPASRAFVCECKAGQFGRRCWHVDAVVAGMVNPARPKGIAR